MIRILRSRPSSIFRQYIGAAVRQDVVRDEFIINCFLIPFADRGFAAFRTACTVVHAEATFFRARIGDHNARTGRRITGQQNRMTYVELPGIKKPKRSDGRMFFFTPRLLSPGSTSPRNFSSSFGLIQRSFFKRASRNGISYLKTHSRSLDQD